MIFAANFKCNLTRAETRAYIDALGQKRFADDTRIFLFPPATALDRYHTPHTVGAQNAYPTDHGAFTGEIGLQQLNEFEIKTLLIGHSERREILGESQAFIAEKYRFFQEAGFTILYCIGEPLSVREAGDNAVADFLMAQFEGIDTAYEKLIVAYEPIWAIGTGRAATREEIAATHAMLRKEIDAPLLYGGSVKPDNAAEILSIAHVDGVLVGSASLQVESFTRIIESLH